MSDFSEKIKCSLSDMTNSQKQVASYYLDNPDTVPFLTLDDIAMQIGVSTTTVIRFARLLGYSGFSEMQKDVQKTLISKVSLPERLTSLQNSVDTQNQLLINSMQNDIDDITNTFANLNSELLDQVIRMINDANTVYILGLRSSFALAHYLTSRIAQIRPNVRLIQTDGMLFPEDFGGCNEKDVCIAFLFPRYSKTTSNLLHWLKKRKTPIIMFTSPNIDEVKDYADYILPCSISGVSFKNSFAAPIALINYLASATAILDRDRALNTIRDTEDFLNMGYYLGL